MSPAFNRIREDSQVEDDAHQLTVDGQDSRTTIVNRLKRRNNKEGAQPKPSRATVQMHLPEERLSRGQDDPMPQLTSQDQDEAARNVNKSPRPTPKPRSQASYHLENE